MQMKITFAAKEAGRTGGGGLASLGVLETAKKHQEQRNANLPLFLCE